VSADRGPIFLGGLSHSGKTQLRIVLGAHPEISMTRRTYLWNRYYGRFGDLAHPRNLERCLSAMLGDPGVQRLEPDRDRLRREFVGGAPTYARLFGLLHRHHAERLGKRRWGDQLGFVERFAEPIFASFPSAKLVHMIRDPRSVYAASSKGRPRPGAVGWRTAVWLRSAALAERNTRRYATGYLVVRYETFASSPLETARAVCTFLEEDWHPEMAEALATVAFDPVTQDRAGDAPDVSTAAAFVDRYARRELLTFDYPPDEVRLVPRDRLSYLLVERPLNRATMAAWHVLRGGSPAAKAEG